MCYVRRHRHDKWPPLVVDLFAFWIGSFVWKVDLYKDDIDNNIVTPSTKMKMVWLTNSSMCQATIEWRCCSNMWDHVALSLRSLNKIWKVSTAKHHCLHFRFSVSTFVFFFCKYYIRFKQLCLIRTKKKCFIMYCAANFLTFLRQIKKSNVPRYNRRYLG